MRGGNAVDVQLLRTDFLCVLGIILTPKLLSPLAGWRNLLGFPVHSAV